MSFLMRDFNFKDIENNYVILMDNLEGDIISLINSSLLSLCITSPSDKIKDFSIQIKTKKNTNNEYYISLENLQISDQENCNYNVFSFEDRLNEIFKYITNSLITFSFIINKPINIDINYDTSTIMEKHSNPKISDTGVEDFHIKIARFQLSCFLSLSSKYGFDIMLDFEKNLDNKTFENIKPLKIKDEIKNEYSYLILNRIASSYLMKSEDYSFSLPLFNLIYNKVRNQNEIDFFKHSLKEAQIEYEKNKILSSLQTYDIMTVIRKRI